MKFAKKIIVLLAMIFLLTSCNSQKIVSPSQMEKPIADTTKVTSTKSGNFGYGDELTFYKNDDKTNKNPTAISVVAKYLDAMKGNNYDAWLSTMTAVRKTGFLSNKNHELGVLSLDVLDVHYEADTIYKHNILESELAQKNGWTADNMTIVYALFDVKYDHSKVPGSDGKIEWHFFLVRKDKSSPWYIQDWGYGNF